MTMALCSEDVMLHALHKFREENWQRIQDSLVHYAHCIAFGATM